MSICLVLTATPEIQASSQVLATSTSSSYQPPVLSGIKIFPKEPFRFDFLVDAGDEASKDFEELSSDEQSLINRADLSLHSRSMRLIKYFLVALTVPEGDLWVNLSPYEKDRIIPDALGQTEMGRDLLAQDYILKQLTASLMHPDGEVGKEFWSTIYSKAYDKLGTVDIPVDTFNKVWIVPDKIEVYQNLDVAYVTKATMKVMLESDYVAAQQSDKEVSGKSDRDRANTTSITDHSSTHSKQIIRSVILPVIEHEVNHGKHFAPLRQILNSMILAKWYEQHFKNSVIGQKYVDQNKISSLRGADGDATIQNIYQEYVNLFKDGMHDVLKEEYDPVSQELVTKKYFSGGVNNTDFAMIEKNNLLFSEVDSENFLRIEMKAVSPDFQKNLENLDKDSAMLLVKKIFSFFQRNANVSEKFPTVEGGFVEFNTSSLNTSEIILSNYLYDKKVSEVKGRLKNRVLTIFRADTIIQKKGYVQKIIENLRFKQNYFDIWKSDRYYDRSESVEKMYYRLAEKGLATYEEDYWYVPMNRGLSDQEKMVNQIMLKIRDTLGLLETPYFTRIYKKEDKIEIHLIFGYTLEAKEKYKKIGLEDFEGFKEIDETRLTDSSLDKPLIYVFSSSSVGGIDLNNLDMQTDGNIVPMNIDPAMMNPSTGSGQDIQIPTLIPQIISISKFKTQAQLAEFLNLNSGSKSEDKENDFESIESVDLVAIYES